MTDIYIYAGSGAVGTTTCAGASALAVRTECEGEVGIVSVDPVHSLSEAFETEVGPEPTVLRPGLTAVEINPEAGTEATADLLAALDDELAAVGLDLDGVRGRLPERLPMGRVVAALEAVAGFAADPTYDAIVFDPGPRDEVRQLLHTPGLFGAGVGVAQAAADHLDAAVEDVAKRVGFGDGEAGSERTGEITGRLERAQAVLAGDGARQIRVVTTPEEAAVRHTDRLVGNVERAGVPVGPLLVNQVVGGEAGGGCEPSCRRCTTRRRHHRDVLTRLRETVTGVPVVALPDLRGTADGVALLERLADHVPT